MKNRMLVAAGFLFACQAAFAQFLVFEGDASAEAAWRAAAGGPIALENFEGFAGGGVSQFNGGASVSSLPVVGLILECDTPQGAFPGVYADPQWAHSGVNQLSNFGAGGWQFTSFTMFAAPGVQVYALAFWQCDPQGDQPMTAFAADGTELGTIVGHINNGSGGTFAGFVSSVPVARIEVTGLLGDGFNHFDDLQTVTTPPPPPCDPDVNCDGSVNGFDIEATEQAVNGDYTNFCQASADLNGDGAENGFDIETEEQRVNGEPC